MQRTRWLALAQKAIMAPQQRLRTALTLLALVSTPRNTVGQRADACDKAPCHNGGTCHESVAADGGSHRHLQDSCTGASLVARTEEIDAQCCGTDDSACAAGIPTSCDSGCAAAFLPFWKVSNYSLYASQQSRLPSHQRA